jgi:hypothetical protein
MDAAAFLEAEARLEKRMKGASSSKDALPNNEFETVATQDSDSADTNSSDAREKRFLVQNRQKTRLGAELNPVAGGVGSIAHRTYLEGPAKGAKTGTVAGGAVASNRGKISAVRISHAKEDAHGR